MLTTVPHKYMYAQKDFLLFEIHILNICTEGTCYLQKYTIAVISYKWYLVLQYLVDALTFNNFFLFLFHAIEGWTWQPANFDLWNQWWKLLLSALSISVGQVQEEQTWK